MKGLVVLCSVGKPEDGEYLARELVERRLAACVNLLPPMTSIYRWRGEVERAEETLLVIKTTEKQFEALKDAIATLHGYDVPEVIGLQITAGHAPYLAWLEESVRS